MTEKKSPAKEKWGIKLFLTYKVMKSLHPADRNWILSRISDEEKAEQSKSMKKHRLNMLRSRRHP
jgi:hypothetical protein